MGPQGWRPKPRKSGVPKPGAPKPGPPRVGPRRVGPKCGGPPKGGVPKISRFFSLSRHSFHSVFPLSDGPFVDFWWCLKPRGAQMCTFGVLWLSCEAPAASGRSRASSDILLLPEGAGVFYTEHSEGNAMISFASQRVCRRGSGGGGATAPSSMCGRPKPSIWLSSKMCPLSSASGMWTAWSTLRPFKL